MAMKYLDKYPKNNARHLWVLKSFYTTLRQMLKSTRHRPVTIMYPYEKEWIPDYYRGRPGLVFDKCVGCGVCERICPTTCIEMVQVEDAKVGKVARPQVNVGRCMMCGYCAEYCPTKAMTTTPEYELAGYTRQDLIFDPYRLAYEGHNEAMEVHMHEHLLSDLQKGVVDRPVNASMVDRPLLDDAKCIGCSRCAKECPVGAVEMVVVGENDKGKPIKRPRFDDAKCVSCERCVMICPKDALAIKEVL